MSLMSLILFDIRSFKIVTKLLCDLLLCCIFVQCFLLLCPIFFFTFVFQDVKQAGAEAKTEL